MKEPHVLAILPHIDLDDFRTTLFWLTYKRAPNATGTNLTRADVLDMEFDEITDHWTRLMDAWESENQRLRHPGQA